MQNDGDELLAVATDGVTLLRIGVAADHFSDDERLIVPSAACAMLRKLLRASKTDSAHCAARAGFLPLPRPASS